MFFSCCIWNCQSNQFTIIDGRKIKLFPYPSDKRIQEQWEAICKTICNNESKPLFRVCELHFERRSFTSNMQLKPYAVPSIFDQPNKGKAPTGVSRTIVTSTPLKKIKSENVYSPTDRTKKLSVFTPSATTPLKKLRSENGESPVDKIKRLSVSTPGTSSPFRSLRSENGNLLADKTKRLSTSTPNTSTPFRNLKSGIGNLPADKSKKLSMSTPGTSTPLRNLRSENVNFSADKTKRLSMSTLGTSTPLQNLKSGNGNLPADKTRKLSMPTSGRSTPLRNFNSENVNLPTDRTKRFSMSTSSSTTPLRKGLTNSENANLTADRTKRLSMPTSQHAQLESPKPLQVKSRFSSNSLNKSLKNEKAPEPIKAKSQTPRNLTKSAKSSEISKAKPYTSKSSAVSPLKTKISSFRYRLVIEISKLRPKSPSMSEDSLCPASSKKKAGSTLSKTKIDSASAENKLGTASVESKIDPASEKNKLGPASTKTETRAGPIKSNIDPASSKTQTGRASSAKAETDPTLLKNKTGPALLKRKLDTANDTRQLFKKSRPKSPDKTLQQNLNVPDENEINTSNQDLLDILEGSSKEQSSQKAPPLNNEGQKRSRCEKGCPLEELVGEGNGVFMCKKCKNVYSRANDRSSNAKKMNSSTASSVKKPAKRKTPVINSSTPKISNIQNLQGNYNEFQNFKTPHQEFLTNVQKGKLNYLNENANKTVNSVSNMPNSSDKAAEKIFQNLINTSGNFSRCVNGCKLTEIIWNERLAYRCTVCSHVFVPLPVTDSSDKIKKINEIVNANSSMEVIDLDNEEERCPTCNKAFPSSEKLFHHIKEHLTCDICYCTFNTQFEYKSHVRQHMSSSTASPFQCHICDLMFAKKEEIKDHISAVHNSNPKHVKLAPKQPILNAYQCNICKILFMHQENLRDHMKLLHSSEFSSVTPSGQFGNVKFSCTICNMEYLTLKDIQNHTQEHLKAKKETFKCHCSKKVFDSKTAFEEHLREHIACGYQCPKCKRGFLDQPSLQKHLENHVC